MVSNGNKWERGRREYMEADWGEKSLEPQDLDIVKLPGLQHYSLFVEPMLTLRFREIICPRGYECAATLPTLSIYIYIQLFSQEPDSCCDIIWFQEPLC